MARAPYLWFLLAGIIAWLLTFAALHAFGASAGAAFWVPTLALYVPLTSAGARRLRDAGSPGHLILRPLVPAAAAAVILALLYSFALVRGATVVLSLLAPGLLIAVGLPLLLWLGVATMVSFSDTMSRLLLASSEGDRA